MGQGFLRRSGAEAKVRLVLLVGALLLSFSSTSAAQAAEPMALDETATEPGVVVYAARTPGPHRVTVVLHGMCGSAANICRYFAEQVSASQHLICPRATTHCDGGGASWPAVGFDEQIEKAVQRAVVVLGRSNVDESRGRTLVGYSLGGYRALELAQHDMGRYPRVMLIGAKVFPNQKLLRESGVERLLLSAGQRDMTYEHMQKATQRLARAGFTARFLGLGPVGHFFTPSILDYLPEALGWLGQQSVN